MSQPMALLVHDGDAMTSKTRQLLNGDDLDVLVASDVEQATVLATKHRPELVVLDMALPDADVKTLCKRWQSDGVLAGTPVLSVSSDPSRRGGPAASLGGGALSYVVRPFSGSEFLARVEMLVDFSHIRRRLEESESRNEAVIESALDAVVGVDSQGKITEWNQQAEQLFGYSREEAVGRDLAGTIIPPQYRDLHQSGFARFLTTGEQKILNTRVEITALRRNGDEFPVELTVSAIHRHRETSFNAFVRDIGPRKRVEAELQEKATRIERQNVELSDTKRELERRCEELKRFTSVVSHDLKNPLNTIGGFAARIERKCHDQLDSRGLELVQRIRSSVDRMSTLISGLLEHALGADADAVLESVDLRDLLDRVLEDLEGSILEARAEVVVDEMPSVAGSCLRLEQLFQNLIANAIKFRSKESPLIHISARTVGDKLEVAICDNGIGIPADKTDDVFGIFKRGHTNSKCEGHGIGLATCRQIVEHHGGLIWIDTTEGKGTTVRFTLPTERGEEKDPALPPRMPPSDSTEGR